MNVSTSGSALFILCWFLGSVHSECIQERDTYFCTNIPQSYPDGLSSLVFSLKNVGEINSNLFNGVNLASVTRLTISNSGVTDIAPEALLPFPNLGTLVLDRNSLTQLSPTWFNQPAVLQNLSLVQNHLEIVQNSMLHNFTGLTSLNLAENKIESVTPDSFFNQNRLASLNMSGNRIKTISADTFRGLTGLTHLNMSNNMIANISPGSFSFMSKLAHLHLSDNNLSRLRPKALPLNTTRIWLNGNPWDCSCGVMDFVIQLQGLCNSSLLEQEMEVTCATPAEWRDQPVWNVTDCETPTTRPTLQPQPTQDAPQLAITVPALTAVIVVLCILLSVVCTLAILWRRKRDSKQVKPSLATAEEADISSASHQREVNSDMSRWNSELATKTYRLAVRAKSAEAELSTTHFCRAGREAQMDLHRVKTETEEQLETTSVSPFDYTRNSEKHGNKEPGVKESRQLNRFLTGKKDLSGEVNEEKDPDEKAALGSENLQDRDQNVIPQAQNSETLQYLTIGADPAKPNPESHKGHKSQKVLVRVSTWPPTSAQWQAHSIAQREGINPNPNLEPEHDQRVKGETMFSSNCQDFKLGQEVKDAKDNLPADLDPEHKVKDNPPLFVSSNQGDRGNMAEDTCSMPPRLDVDSPNLEPVQIDEAELECPKTQSELSLSRSSGVLTPPNQADQLNNKSEETQQITNLATQSNGKSNRKGAPMRAVQVGRSRESQERIEAPPGGGSPNDDCLLVDNEYAYIDLLHEVVQHQGRWTRQRWKQTHLNKGASKRSKQQGH